VAPYGYKDNQWFSYDDEQSLEIKSRYVLDHGLVGLKYLIVKLGYNDHGYNEQNIVVVLVQNQTYCYEYSPFKPITVISNIFRLYREFPGL
jgi:hypothetical protein